VDRLGGFGLAMMNFRVLLQKLVNFYTLRALAQAHKVNT